MLYDYFIENLIGLQGLIVKEVMKDDSSIHIYGELERKVQICPECGSKTKKCS